MEISVSTLEANFLEYLYEEYKRCMLVSTKSEPDFSRWCAFRIIGYVLFVTHLQLTIRELLETALCCRRL